MSLRTIFTSIVALGLAVSFVPAFAFAQTYNCNTNNTWFPHWGNTANCTPGNLLVYVQVPSNTAYTTAQPSNFIVTVTGENTASPSSFAGSLSGTPVLVTGSYTVTAPAMPGYTPSYSTGCTGTLSGNSSATCIVTESASSNYNNYPYSYYPNQYYPYHSVNNTYVAPLYCNPTGQTVTIGTNVTFTATGGGEVSQFNWSNSSVPNLTSYNVGRSYTTTFLSPGTTNVLVTNGAQSATCSVTVMGYPIAGYNYNYPGTVAPIGTTYSGGVTLTPTYIPRLPNTGFEPVDAASLAFVLSFLIAAALVTYPYARKAFSIIIR